MQDELQAILENPCVLTILNNMTEYVYIVDEQGCLQFINPAVEAFENLTNSEVKGKHIKELYTQGESPTLKALYEQKTIPEESAEKPKGKKENFRFSNRRAPRISAKHRTCQELCC